MTIRKKGLRCQVCTGCGLCPGVFRNPDMVKKVHVVTEFETPTSMTAEQPTRKLNHAFPVAIDIGTTTIAMLLYDDSGKVLDRYVTVNPQTRFGADVISRIQEAENPENLQELKDMVQGELKKGFERFRRKVPEQGSLLPVMAANTTETYLTFGWNPAELGRAPFTVSQKLGDIREVDGEQVLVFPGLSAFVGGDITAGMYALELTRKEEITLLIDLGTNGEIVLGNAKKCIACATAAGPAFEGGANKGIWGADMISLLATLRREGLLDASGLLAEQYFDDGVLIGNVRVTKETIRSVQLAKGAIAAGIAVLLKRYGISAAEVDRVVLAGGFGYYLKPEDAVAIGLLPAGLQDKAAAGGNTCLSGCMAAGMRRCFLEDSAILRDLEELVQNVTCINLAEEEGFHEIFMECLSLEQRA